ncbi:MAG: hypothetical protein KGJ79_12605 [Alphaproteobacteria bacterium]|nr:hypothetical protein [Alphaproteobacteria bacterium]MDE2492541.1 hypothetical protein [Alphaproteobacteria bacterium]
MADVTIALALHVAAIVVWIGGVAMVMTVLLSAVKWFKVSEDRVAFFEMVERHFACQARGITLFSGATGLYTVGQSERLAKLLRRKSIHLNLTAVLRRGILQNDPKPLIAHRGYHARLSGIEGEEGIMFVNGGHRERRRNWCDCATRWNDSPRIEIV